MEKLYKLKKKTPYLKKGAVFVKHKKSDNYVPAGMENSPLMKGFNYSPFVMEKMTDWFGRATKKDLEKFGIFTVPAINIEEKEGVFIPVLTEERALPDHRRHGKVIGFMNGIPIEDMKQDPISEGSNAPFNLYDQQTVNVKDFNQQLMESGTEIMSVYVFIGKPPHHKLIDTLYLPGQGSFALYLHPGKTYTIAQEVLNNA